MSNLPYDMPPMQTTQLYQGDDQSRSVDWFEKRDFAPSIARPLTQSAQNEFAEILESTRPEHTRRKGGPAVSDPRGIGSGFNKQEPDGRFVIMPSGSTFAQRPDNRLEAEDTRQMFKNQYTTK